MEEMNDIVFKEWAVSFRSGIYAARIAELMQLRINQKLSEADGNIVYPPPNTIHMELFRCSFSDPGIMAKAGIQMMIDEHERNVEKAKELFKGRKVYMIAKQIRIDANSSCINLYLTPRSPEDHELMLSLHKCLNASSCDAYDQESFITLACYDFNMSIVKLYGAVEYAQINPEKAPVFEFDIQSLTFQMYYNKYAFIDVPKKICMVCDGGIVRSVMASCILNNLAKQRNLKIYAEPRSAFPNSFESVPEKVWDTLKRHDIVCESGVESARYLLSEDYPLFSTFCGITHEAIHRMEKILLFPKDSISSFFHGIPDPYYGEISYDDAYDKIHKLAEQFLGLSND